MEYSDAYKRLSELFQDDVKWCIIKYLVKHREAPIKDVAKACGTSIGEIIKILREMEQKGVVELRIEKSRQYVRLKGVSE
ncbi:winged helix-turn-helix transcriptional regulator [Pyrobaculum ferrireducens]|uniref:Uncharacterized protein n=1 Tax=Pyrobaculum ferrireducens TaxID=1104324 RepID=G7VCC8_9CREN|nr:winged helix-turn-helix transcriptional regulator [Pyrobaculum ferrireducens]AET32548.1 hypothetical protein P186_1115 [Pyrobaculum ferrireducens]